MLFITLLRNNELFENYWDTIHKGYNYLDI
jgi:hypothetical protein